MLNVILIIAGAILQLLGLAGCVLPVLAGPPLNFVGLLLLGLARGWKIFSPSLWLILVGITLITVILDYLLPIGGARKYGSTKWGTWGAFLGMLVGVFFFPPLGLIIGAFFGAVVGELLAGKENREALRTGWGIFIGYFVSMLLKLVASGVMTFFFIKVLVR
ncbi:MAG: DUF456 domain-containing protein [Candidatus Saccharicenans sp.]|jgi:uncharacterized protein YqgC (DUF456 family)|nr:DUF456 domain-containing protein [Candidatus Saccharicenans sp.]MDH7575093.1 DUF456 domain-containing protein [Candidatus Saccharicenans sp.]